MATFGMGPCATCGRDIEFVLRARSDVTGPIITVRHDEPFCGPAYFLLAHQNKEQAEAYDAQSVTAAIAEYIIGWQNLYELFAEDHENL